MTTESRRDAVASSDDEIKSIIRQRRANGLPCSPVALRDAVGRGGTERLARLLRDVRIEGLSDIPSALSGSVTSASDTLPPEIKKRFEAMEAAVVASIARARLEERTTNSTVIAGLHEEGERRVHALTAMELAGADDAIALATTLDVMHERVEELEAALAAAEARAIEASIREERAEARAIEASIREAGAEARAIDASIREAGAEARVGEAERSAARVSDTLHAIRIERDALQLAMKSLQSSLEPLIKKLSLTPPSRRTSRAARKADTAT